MGNSIGGRKRAKVMKIDGETIKLKTPVQVSEVVKDYPGHVLLESEAVKHFGIRAKPLEPQQHLRPKKIYFLVELPKFPEEPKGTRRVRSGIQMGAKDRLELLMLSRRAVSDLSSVKPSTSHGHDIGMQPEGRMRVKMRLPRAQVAKLIDESKDDLEVAERIADLYMEKSGQLVGGDARREAQWRPGPGSVEEISKPREKHVSFVPAGGEIHLVASQQ